MTGIQDGVSKLLRRQHDQEHETILEWLTPLDYASQQSDIINRRQEGTELWLLTSEEFQKWVNQGKKTLFCPGIPGAGKTMMSSIVVKLLLEIGAELETKDDNGQTPLSYAAGNGHEVVVKLLLEKGAELDTKSKYGQTPLSWAAGNGHEAVVKLLLEKGTELETKDGYGQTPLSYASGNGHEAVVKLLLEKGAELETKDGYGQTPLSYASGNGHEAVVKLLLEIGLTPLAWASRYEDEDEEDEDWEDVAPKVVKVIELLLAQDGIDLDSKNSNGRTPVILGCREWARGGGEAAAGDMR